MSENRVPKKVLWFINVSSCFLLLWRFHEHKNSIHHFQTHPFIIHTCIYIYIYIYKAICVYIYIIDHIWGLSICTKGILMHSASSNGSEPTVHPSIHQLQRSSACSQLSSGRQGPRFFLFALKRPYGDL